MIHEIIPQDQFIDLYQEAKKYGLAIYFDFGQYSSIFIPKYIWIKYFDTKNIDYVSDQEWLGMKNRVYGFILQLEIAMYNSWNKNIDVEFDLIEIPRYGDHGQFEPIRLKAVSELDCHNKLIIKLCESHIQGDSK